LTDWSVARGFSEGHFHTSPEALDVAERRRAALLVLEDGRVFKGESFGAEADAEGEVVFNTGMIGYPETLTDPSYRGQILAMTYPLVGNYGVPGDEREDGLLRNYESEGIHVRGLVVAEHSEEYSHWSAEKSLSDWLAEQGVPGISGIDTRALTKHLRERGTALGRIVAAGSGAATAAMKIQDPNRNNLAAEVGVREPVEYGSGKRKVVVVDCGVKNNILRAFLKRGMKVVRVPWDFDYSDEDCDGVVLSNGPGDPKRMSETISSTRKYLQTGRPLLGICLGSQILGLAAGAETYKLKYGHRGQNQPCLEAGTRRCYITSQNHGFAVDATTLPEDWREWFRNNNDGTNEGIRHISKPFFGAQFHPEASPGPDDTEFIFDIFARSMR
jgi:carbamoyl-phosphate synthase small subunit